MANQITEIIPSFFDADGAPLDNGYIYIGTAALNPETNPISVYWDAAGTIPAAQPLRTSNGYIVRNGIAAVVYKGSGSFSLTIRDRNSRLVMSIPTVEDPISTVTSAYIAADAVITSAYIAADTAITTAYQTADTNLLSTVGRRNYIINGDFAVAQRATTYALTTTSAYGSVDRWASFMATSAAGICNQTAITGGTRNFVIKLGRNNGSTLTGVISLAQAVETAESLQLAGNTVKLSYVAKQGANFSGTTLGVVLRSGTGTDQTVAQMTAAAWTGAASPINTTQALTTSYVRYSHTVALSSTVTQVGVQFFYTPSGTAGADDNVYIYDVQLEISNDGLLAPFQRESYAENLKRCERYYQTVILGNIVTAAGAGTVVCASANFASMRTTPIVAQLATGVFYGDSNVTTTTTSYNGVNFNSVNGSRSSSIAGQAQFSERISLTAEL